MVKTLKIRYKDRIANSWVPMNASRHFGVISHLKNIIVICKYRTNKVSNTLLAFCMSYTEMCYIET